jgi:nitrite reductase/ring-hydroxylating ferredoxin subunit
MTWRFRRPLAAARPAVFATGGEADAVDADRTDADRTGPRWVDVGGLADLRDNRLVADLNGTSVLVVRTGRALAAVENECPHLGQQLSDGQVSGRVIRCAAHGYRWDLATGQAVQGLRVQRRRPLREVPVRLVGDRILLGRDEGPTY